MFETLPKTAQEVMKWKWSQFEAYYNDLAARPLSHENVHSWLADWSEISDLVGEVGTRLEVATTVNTADEEANQLFTGYLDTIFPASQAAEQKLKQKLIEAKLEPQGFDIALRCLRAEAELYREENLPLLSEERKLGLEYDAIAGAQTVRWEGQERTLAQMNPFLITEDRVQRERVWRLIVGRRLQDRAAQDALWAKFMDVRQTLAKNAGMDYRAYRWQQQLRFDYTPEEAKRFDAAIEEAVVPAATRLYEAYRQKLGVATLRPWDVIGLFNPIHIPALKPYAEQADLENKTEAIFQCVDPKLGGYFKTMRDEQLLDLFNRRNKAPGGYCTSFQAARRPFIFMNAVGLHDDVQTLLHEGGHAFHAFETAPLPYAPQRYTPLEFAEVASMSMELLAGPYLGADQGGFYSAKDAARARTEHLESMITFWPYMALIDSFQHWVYENPTQGRDGKQCDKKWAELFKRYIPAIDWSGLDEELTTFWRRQLHIFQIPFYYIEYGLAQLGATQVWANSLKDQAGAVASYRKALSLGYTVSLPQLFESAGGRLAFDAETLKAAVDLIERTLSELNAAVQQAR